VEAVEVQTIHEFMVGHVGFPLYTRTETVNTST